MLAKTQFLAFVDLPIYYVAIDTTHVSTPRAVKSSGGAL
jgi:hypothetical protein